MLAASKLKATVGSQRGCTGEEEGSGRAAPPSSEYDAWGAQEREQSCRRLRREEEEQVNTRSPRHMTCCKHQCYLISKPRHRKLFQDGGTKTLTRVVMSSGTSHLACCPRSIKGLMRSHSPVAQTARQMPTTTSVGKRMAVPQNGDNHRLDFSSTRDGR